MKKVYLIFLLLIAFSLISFDMRNLKKVKVLNAVSPQKLSIDFNKNNQLDDDETVNISGIKDFNYNNKLISNKETLYINFLFSKWAKSNLNNKYGTLSFKNGDYDLKFNKSQYSELILRESFAQPNNSVNNKYFSIINLRKMLEPVKNDNLVLVNRANKKYHKLDCKYARLAHNFAIIPLKTAKESGFSPCGYCYNKSKKHFSDYKFSNFDVKPPPYTMEFEDLAVFFIDSSNTKKPDNYCSQIACRTLLNEINSAKMSIDIAIYGIENEPKLLNAIINAQNRGVRIRLVTDVDAKGCSYYKNNANLISKIQNNITDKNSLPQYIMHNKFLIFDNKSLWTGSSNLTSTDFSNFNTNYDILTTAPNLVKAYSNEFELLYNGKFHIQKNGFTSEKAIKGCYSAYFSPRDEIITSKLIPLVDSATSYVYMPIFYLTHKGLTEALIRAKNRNVDVKIIIDSTNAHSKYTVHKKLRDAGIPVKTENKAGKLHAKMLVIDDKYSVIGSMNFTKSGEKYNDENVIILNNPNIAKYLKSTFIYLWKTIPDKYLKIDPYAESKSSIGSCSDGVDNDFDGKIDSKDEFCK